MEEYIIPLFHLVIAFFATFWAFMFYKSKFDILYLYYIFLLPILWIISGGECPLSIYYKHKYGKSDFEMISQIINKSETMTNHIFQTSITILCNIILMTSIFYTMIRNNLSKYMFLIYVILFIFYFTIQYHNIHYLDIPFLILFILIVLKFTYILFKRKYIWK